MGTGQHFAEKLRIELGMKTGKVAKVFGVDRKTISNWTDMPQFRRFFTEEAHGVDRTQRDYLEPDLLVINTIRVLRNKSMDWDDIAAYLASGERERELPPSAFFTETTAPIAQYGRIVELQTSLDATEEQVELLQEEVERLRLEMQQRIDIVRDEERLKAREREQQLLDEIINLNRQMARLEYRIELMEEQDGEDQAEER
jgi:DNA-binding transcriptional MerR regulator